MKSVKTVYVVDDDEDDRMFIREALQEVIGQVQIIEAFNGQDLLDQLMLRKEDSGSVIILLDINMPRMNGLETLVHIRSLPGGEYLPVIMFSTSDHQQLIRNAYQVGVNAYLKKPVLLADYAFMAESVNVCFFNSYPLLKEGRRPKNNFRTKSILVIEDNADHWELMKVALSQGMPKATVVRMKDEKTTLDFLDMGWHNMPQHPQLVLLELYLPTRKEGLNLLEKIRSFLFKNSLSTIPFIVFSNSNHQEDIKACYQRQANDYIVKPIDLQESVYYFKTLNEFIWYNYTTN